MLFKICEILVYFYAYVLYKNIIHVFISSTIQKFNIFAVPLISKKAVKSQKGKIDQLILCINYVY